MPLLDNIVTGGVRMSKYISKSARKRIPMTSKMGNKNYYKGKGATKEGTLNSKGAPASPCVEFDPQQAIFFFFHVFRKVW